ncbi:MAG: hypothetical protein HYZ81_10990 [Nitrospinae bacterium]|nr:hypothetical protein [Nitrospinota bacterium]
MDQAQRRQAYEAYDAGRPPDDATEAWQLFADCAMPEAEISDERSP